MKDDLIALSVSISHDDACRLSRAFNERSDLATPQDQRVNEWLKRVIAVAYENEVAP